MKDKITLGKAGKVFGEIKEVEVEYDAGNEMPVEVFEEALRVGKENMKAWGFDKGLVVNAAVLELREHAKRLLTQPGQFFILTEHELEAVRFLSCLFESISPFFVSTEAIEAGVFEHGNRRSLPTEGVSHQTRRFSGADKDRDYAFLLSRFLSKENLPLILSALGIFTSGRADSLDVLSDGVCAAERKDASTGVTGSVERRFVTRAALALYHDWVAVTNPTRHRELNWTLPPLMIKNLDDLRLVNSFFFKALPAIRQTNVAAMVSPDQLFKLIPGGSEEAPAYLLETAPSFDISQDLGDLILAISKDSPEVEDFDMIYDDSGRQRIAPGNSKFWERHKIMPVRAEELAKACRRLDYAAHDLADLTALILTFKYRTPVVVSGRGYSSDIVEFVGRSDRTGRGYSFNETGCELVDIQQRAVIDDSPCTYNPLLRTYIAALEGIDENKREQTYAFKGHLPRDGFQRTQRRLVAFQKWFGKELFSVEPTWL